MPDKYDAHGGAQPEKRDQMGGEDSFVAAGLDSLEDIESFVKNLEREVASLKEESRAFGAEEARPAERGRPEPFEAPQRMQRPASPDDIKPASIEEPNVKRPTQRVEASHMMDESFAVREGKSSFVRKAEQSAPRVEAAKPTPGEAYSLHGEIAPGRQPQERGNFPVLRDIEASLPVDTERQTEISKNDPRKPFFDPSEYTADADRKADIPAESAETLAPINLPLSEKGDGKAARSDPYAAPAAFDPWGYAFSFEKERDNRREQPVSPASAPPQPIAEQSNRFGREMSSFEPDEQVLPATGQDFSGDDSRRAAKEFVSALEFSYSPPADFLAPRKADEETAQGENRDERFAVGGGPQAEFSKTSSLGKEAPESDLRFVPSDGGPKADAKGGRSATHLDGMFTFAGDGDEKKTPPRDASKADFEDIPQQADEEVAAQRSALREKELSDSPQSVTAWYPKETYVTKPEGTPARAMPESDAPPMERPAYFDKTSDSAATQQRVSEWRPQEFITTGEQDADAGSLLRMVDDAQKQPASTGELPRSTREEDVADGGLDAGVFPAIGVFQPHDFEPRLSTQVDWKEADDAFGVWNFGEPDETNEITAYAGSSSDTKPPIFNEFYFFDEDQTQKDAESPISHPVGKDIRDSADGPRSGAESARQEEKAAASSPFDSVTKAPEEPVFFEADNLIGAGEGDTARALFWNAGQYESLTDTVGYTPPANVLTQPEINVIADQETDSYSHLEGMERSRFETIGEFRQPLPESKEPVLRKEEDGSGAQFSAEPRPDFRNDGFELHSLQEAETPALQMDTAPSSEPKEPVVWKEEDSSGAQTKGIGIEKEPSADASSTKSELERTYSLFGELATPVLGEPIDGMAGFDKDDALGAAASFGNLQPAGGTPIENDISAMIDSLSGAVAAAEELPMQTHLDLPEEHESPKTEDTSPQEDERIAEASPPVTDIVPLKPVREELLEEPPEQYGFDGISGRLEAGMIVSEMQANYSDNNLLPSEDEAYVTFHKVTSIYNMKFQNGTSRPLYENLEISVPKGSCTAFVSETPLDVHALLRATKNRAGIKDGYITVGDSPSEDSSNLLYIENDSMITFGMTALQFLMLCLSEVKGRAAAKQERLLNVLENVGLSQIALVDTKLLTKFQRIALLLLTAAMGNLIDGVVLNPNKLPLDMADEFVVRQVFKLLHDANKTVLIVGNNLVLTSSVANRIVALKEGKVIFDGEFSEFVEHYCDSAFSFSTADTGFVMQLRDEFPDVKYEKRGDRVTVRYEGGDADYLTAVITKVLGAGIDGRTIATKKKSFERAVGRMVEE